MNCSGYVPFSTAFHLRPNHFHAADSRTFFFSGPRISCAIRFPSTYRDRLLPRKAPRRKAVNRTVREVPTASAGRNLMIIKSNASRSRVRGKCRKNQTGIPNRIVNASTGRKGLTNETSADDFETARRRASRESSSEYYRELGRRRVSLSKRYERKS